jgi:hypothetical protein
MNSITPSDIATQETTESEAGRIQSALRSLKTLLEGDEEEQRETFAYLKEALDEDRPSERKLFK